MKKLNTQEVIEKIKDMKFHVIETEKYHYCNSNNVFAIKAGLFFNKKLIKNFFIKNGFDVLSIRVMRYKSRTVVFRRKYGKTLEYKKFVVHLGVS